MYTHGRYSRRGRSCGNLQQNDKHRDLPARGWDGQRTIAADPAGIHTKQTQSREHAAAGRCGTGKRPPDPRERMWICGARRGSLFLFCFEWFMAFASVHDSMMISGSRRHRDRCTRECGGANRECQRIIAGMSRRTKGHRKTRAASAPNAGCVRPSGCAFLF